MARSHSVYIVQGRRTGIIEGAWTVKHELVSWLNSRDIPRKSIEFVYDVVRFRDGQGGRGTVIPWTEIPTE